MSKAIPGGKVEREVLSLLEQLLTVNDADLSEVTQLLVGKHTDEALALSITTYQRNATAMTALMLLSRNLINDAEAYLLSHTRKRKSHDDNKRNPLP